jgi:hypothetical protein
MDIQKFATLVAQMRAEQKRYFRTRQPDALNKSKVLEKEVDQAIEQIQQGQYGTQQNLF